MNKLIATLIAVIFFATNSYAGNIKNAKIKRVRAYSDQVLTYLDTTRTLPTCHTNNDAYVADFNSSHPSYDQLYSMALVTMTTSLEVYVGLSSSCSAAGNDTQDVNYIIIGDDTYSKVN